MKPADGISEDMATWWRVLARRYRFGAQHLKILQAACESWDRKTAAGALLKRDGLVTITRHGEQKAHPAVAIERDARTAFLRAVRELALADDDLPEDIRPPRLRHYKGR